MSPTVASVRRAGPALFSTHLFNALVSAVVASEMFVGAAPSQPSTAALAQPDGLELLAAFARLRHSSAGADMLSHLWPTAIVLLLMPCWRAFWLRAMGGDAVPRALSRATTMLPWLWLLLGLHIAAQALWAALAWHALLLIDGLVPAHVSRPMADGLGAAIAVAWGACALAVWTRFELAVAHYVASASPIEPGWRGRRARLLVSLSRSPGGKRLALSTLRHGLLRGTELALLPIGLWLASLAATEQHPITLLVAHQALAVVGLAARATWVAHTRVMVVTFNPPRAPGLR